MARVLSQGLHKPSSITYLVAESILPPDPPESSYTWQQSFHAAEGRKCCDEILTTTSCIVWSRNGHIKRILNLDIEGEPVAHSFITTFQTQREVTALDNAKTNVQPESAVVAVLKTQIHILLMSGDTHVIPLNFEVENAFPLHSGFVLQTLITKGPRSHDDSNHELYENPSASKATDRLWNHSLGAGKQHDDRIPSHTKLPRTFAFTRLISELGLVVAGSARRPEDLEHCHPLPAGEDLVYVSPESELQGASGLDGGQVHVAVTANSSQNTLTLWQIVYSHEDALKGTKRPMKKENTRRASSNTYGRHPGASTPVARATTTFRESFDGFASGMGDNTPFAAGLAKLSDEGNDLAAQLGHEFEHAGVQTRSARRVSSMLARTDLGSSNDRSAFNEAALGPVGRKSLSRSIRRGESLGGFSDRHSSGRRRSSFQAASSTISDGTSFLDIPVSHLLDDNVAGSGLYDRVNEDTKATMKHLPRNLGLMKLKGIPYEFEKDSSTSPRHLQVITMLAPDRSTADERRSRMLAVCIMNQIRKELTIINVALRPSLASSHANPGHIGYELKAVEIRRGHSIVDACKIVSGATSRLLTISETRHGQNILQLEAPWAPSFIISLPHLLTIPELSGTSLRDVSGTHYDREQQFASSGTLAQIVGLRGKESRGDVLLVDNIHRCHKLQLSLRPSDPLIGKILDMTNFVLPPELHDSLLNAFWEIKRWLEAQDMSHEIEWISLIVTLFILAVPFISHMQSRPAPSSRRRRAHVPRTSTGATDDLTQWNTMLDADGISNFNHHMNTASWTWLTRKASDDPDKRIPLKHNRSNNRDTFGDGKANSFLVDCIDLARDFLQSPAGEAAMGPEGYLPVAVDKDRNVRRTALASIVIGLHFISEEEKLDDLLSCAVSTRPFDLAPLIVQLCQWLKWPDWQAEPGQYYATDLKDGPHLQIENSVIDTLEIPSQPFVPPSIYKFAETCLFAEGSEPFPSLLLLVSQPQALSKNHPLRKEAASLTPRLFATAALFGKVGQIETARDILRAVIPEIFPESKLSVLPDGLAAFCLRAAAIARGQPQRTISKEVSRLLDAESSRLEVLSPGVKPNPWSSWTNHEAIRDNRSISSSAVDAESFSRWDVSSELERQAVTRLIFGEDRRFQEASKLVNQTRPPLVECKPEPGWSEADLLEAQKELAQHVTKRTFAVTAGRGMMHFNARIPLLTEKVPIPAFNLQCIMKAHGQGDGSQNMTFSADKNLFTEDKTSWAFFHNGAASGLMIAQRAKWIDTSWIIYNKPPELTNRHAGFLLALGLNGHLKSLAKWVAFKYLTPKHTMTSIGLLIGLAASYRGTMDALITRLLSVHVTRLLPPGAAELNLSSLTQTAGLMGIGLLYCGSQHRRMSEVMLSEIEHTGSEEPSGDEPILRDEGYRLAAGFALGLINLGQGRNLHGLHDMGVVERLLTVAVGPKNVTMVHVLDRATAGAVIAVALIFMKTNDISIARKIDIPDTLHQFDYVRPDVFLLRTIARHLIMWQDVEPTLEFIRQSLPSTYQQRADLATTKRLNTDDLPFFNILGGLCFAMALRFAGTHRQDVRDLLVSYLDQFIRLSRLPALNYDSRVTLNGVRNCLDVIALSCSTVMAGSGDLVIFRRLRALHGRIDKETPFGSHLAAHMALGTLFLSGGTATFSTSDLAIAALVIAFYPVFPTEILDNRSHLQALRHLWVLAVDNRCLVPRDAATNHVISGISAEIRLYDGRNLIVTTPGLLPDLDTVAEINFNHELYWPIQLDIAGKGTPNSGRRPSLDVFLHRRPLYGRPSSSTFDTEFQALDDARGISSINTMFTVSDRQKSHEARNNEKNQDPFEWVLNLDTLQDLDHAERALILSIDTIKGRQILDASEVDSRLEFEHGTLGVDVDFEALDGASPDADAEVDTETQTGNPVSDSLEAANRQRRRRLLPGRPLDRDKLWQLRLLLAAMDRWDRELEKENADVDFQNDSKTVGEMRAGNNAKEHDGLTLTPSHTQWMKRDVIDRLRERVWRMASSV